MIGPVTSDDVLGELRAALAPHGVFLRGVVSFAVGETAPSLKDGQAARSIVLLGNVGGSLWSEFERWRGGLPDRGGENPLDAWSKAVIEPVARAYGATAYFPSDPPWQPFQQWAMRAEGLKASPLGILIHPHYGLWHGYRGALGFAHALPTAARHAEEHPCDHCPDRPCLSSCLSGTGSPVIRFPDSTVPCPSENTGRAGGLHGWGVSGPKRLSGRKRPSLLVGTVAVSYGCPQFVDFPPPICSCRAARSGAHQKGLKCFVV